MWAFGAILELRVLALVIETLGFMESTRAELPTIEGCILQMRGISVCSIRIWQHSMA
jgi:hypothetical protein